MSSRYLYCGLILESEYPFPELATTDSGTLSDIQIRETRLGSIPSDLRKYGPNWAIGPEEAWWWIEDLVYFRIRREIIDIDPRNAEDSLVRALLLEAPMAMAMIYQKRFCLNAASVAYNGEALVFCGASGSGRSTAAARLALLGGAIISDSLARIDLAEDKPARIIPQGSGSMLWPHSLALLGLEESFGEQVRKETLLRRVNFDLVQQPMEINRIYWRSPHPAPHRVGKAAAECLSSAQRFRRLAAITSGRLWIDPAGQATAHFQWCIGLARKCNIQPAPDRYFRQPEEATYIG